MNQKKAFVPFVALVTVASLSSCVFFHPEEINSFFHNSHTNPTSADYSDKVTYPHKATGSTSNLNMKNIGLGYGYHYLPSTGDRKILVIPIATTDYGFTTSQLDQIEKGFFGDATQTGWESVSSFYEKSSGGQLHLTGEVTKTVTFQNTATELYNQFKKYDDSQSNYTDVLLKKALAALEDKMDLSEYDTDGDGMIDACWMVYAPSYATSAPQNNFYWAFTTWTMDETKFDGLYANTYAWASVEFLNEGGYGKPDAHTFIHETGHMLGLDDYYSYDYDGKTNYDSPLGGIDMMDFNIGDHSAFSKYLLGWKKPLVLSDEYLASNNYTLTLSAFEKDNASILIPAKRNGKVSNNGTPMDEYILLQYYTPTELNKQDSQKAYPGSGVKCYTDYGVLAYHVNASVGKLIADSKGNISPDGYIYDSLPNYDSRTWGYQFLYVYLYSNTNSMSFGTLIDDQSTDYYRTRLYSLLPAAGRKTLMKTPSLIGSNTCLFRKNTNFNEVYPEFYFDDGSVPAYDFTVTALSTNDCTITFAVND